MRRNHNLLLYIMLIANVNCGQVFGMYPDDNGGVVENQPEGRNEGNAHPHNHPEGDTHSCMDDFIRSSCQGCYGFAGGAAAAAWTMDPVSTAVAGITGCMVTCGEHCFEYGVRRAINPGGRPLTCREIGRLGCVNGAPAGAMGCAGAVLGGGALLGVAPGVLVGAVVGGAIVGGCLGGTGVCCAGGIANQGRHAVKHGVCCCKKASALVTQQPQRSNQTGDRPEPQPENNGSDGPVHGCMETRFLIPGYNRSAQASSLVALRGVFLGASDQIISSMKSLVFRAYQGSAEEGSHFVSMQPKQRLYAIQGLSKITRSTMQEKTTQGKALKNIGPKVSYNLFGFMDTYETNLERKARSGRVGVSIRLMPGIKGTFAYNHSKQGVKTHDGLSLSGNKGSVEVHNRTEGLSTAFVINPNKGGLTGHVASSYNWGRVKTRRHVNHGYTTIRTKGTPESSLSGGLFQVGYNFPVKETHTFTPYFENAYASVRWKGYEEKSNFLPCAISTNKERVLEQSVGLRHQWLNKQETRIQSWIAHIEGRRHVSGLSSKPLRNMNPWYEITIPEYKSHYSGTEVGVSCQISYTETCKLGFDGSMRLRSIGKPDKQMYSCYVQYMY